MKTEHNSVKFAYRYGHLLQEMRRLVNRIFLHFLDGKNRFCAKVHCVIFHTGMSKLEILNF